MAGFPTDLRPNGTAVTDAVPPATSPVSGNLVFDHELIRYKVSDDWNTWSHGYSGDVYFLDEFALGSTLTMTLPGDTKAFYFYAEPNFADLFDFTVSSGSAFAAVSIDGTGGARGFGFYTDDPSESLTTITISSAGTWPDGFAVGEFGINSIPGVPDGGVSSWLFAFVVIGLGAIQRRIRS